MIRQEDGSQDGHRKGEKKKDKKDEKNKNVQEEHSIKPSIQQILTTVETEDSESMPNCDETPQENERNDVTYPFDESVMNKTDIRYQRLKVLQSKYEQLKALMIKNKKLGKKLDISVGEAAKKLWKAICEIKKELEGKAPFQQRKDMAVTWQRNQTSDGKEQDTFRSWFELTDEQSTEDAVCKEKGCSCPLHKFDKNKNSHLGNTETILPENNRTSRRSRCENTSEYSDDAQEKENKDICVKEQLKEKEQDTFRSWFEDTDEQSTEDAVCKEKGCSCPLHKFDKNKNSHRGNTDTNLPENNRMSRSRCENTSEYSDDAQEKENKDICVKEQLKEKEQDIFRNWFEDTDEQSTEDAVCKEKGCSCPLHKFDKNKNSHRGNTDTNLPGNNRTSRRSRFENTSECSDDAQEKENKDICVKEQLKEKRRTENAVETEPKSIVAKLCEEVTHNVQHQLEDKIVVSENQLENILSKWLKYPTSALEGQDKSQESSQKPGNQHMPDLICKVKGCKCPWHKDSYDKSSRRADKHPHKNRSHEKPLPPRRNGRRHTSADDAGVDGLPGDDSSSANESDSFHKHDKHDFDKETLPARDVPKSYHEMNTSAGGAGGGGSSGDESSSESDSDKSEEQIPSNKKVQRKEDIKQWNNAIDNHDLKTIKELMKSGNLPESDHIRKACAVLGRESPTVARICRKVSRWIKDQDPYIGKVEPAYDPTDEDGVTFIIYLRQHDNDLNYGDFRYEVLIRVIGQYKPEGKEIVDEEVKKRLQFTLEEANKLSKCLDEHSKPLMEKHSNLQMISASHFKSKHYGNPNLEETTCVVFYVRVKGFIPLREEPLPRTLNGIPTDIREGGFDFLSNATDVHTNLKTGCEIAGKNSCNGTLGPFLKDNDNIYCLTAAHVLYGTPTGGEPEYDWPSMEQGKTIVDVFQPNPKRLKVKSRPFGSVALAKYKQGGHNVSGIDLAVIQVHDWSRRPISGEFPESQKGSNMEEGGDDDGNTVHTLTYNNGEICESDFLENNNAVEVLKFGSVTGETRGLLHLAGTSVRFDNCLNDSKGVLLYKQVEITYSVENQIFANHGDSGAVVLVSHGGDRRDLRALALLIGKSTTGTIIATPMYAIFDELNLTNRHFMRFQKRNVNQSISTDSGFNQSTAADITKELEETVLKPKFELIENTMAENKKETTAIRAEVGQLRIEINSKFDGMMQLLTQVLTPSQSGNKNDDIQNNGTEI